MTRLFNDPHAFADEMIEGFVAAHGRHVRHVPGGVVRRAASPPGSVAVVIGGGSGHYPAFGGLVGAGLAHGAAMGNLFASPSAQQVYSVAKAAERGGGVLFSYGNYAGDVLNFDQAQDRLLSEGIDCRTVVVTDDVSSAARDERARRRGIAGDLCVFKVASAAAEAGCALPEVADIAQRANERTRSFGVAFGGCTLPGAAAPLFTVPAGRMAVGLGVHGEPGIGETDVPTADGLAELFVTTLLGELPAGYAQATGARAAVILNGLGSVKYEELFVVYRRVAQLLADAGVEIVEPEVGELVTSFDMAGASLTLFWLDDELEALWRAPADTPAYRKGSVRPGADQQQAQEVVVEAAAPPPAAAASRAAAAVAARAFAAAAVAIDEQAESLGRLDAVAGDGDHGIGMQRGSGAAAAAANAALGEGAGLRTVLLAAADAWADRAGGTSGALWGVALRAFGGELRDDAAPTAAAVVCAVDAARRAVQAAGGAAPGDKTMVDALVPFSDTLAAAIDSGSPLPAGWAAAARVAGESAAATAGLLPRLGRARPHAERSLGNADPGAESFAIVVEAVATVLTAQGECR